jgi:hypothetical protein
MNIQFQFNSSHWVFENGYIKCDSQIYVEGKVFFNVPNQCSRACDTAWQVVRGGSSRPYAGFCL